MDAANAMKEISLKSSWYQVLRPCDFNTEQDLRGAQTKIDDIKLISCMPLFGAA